MSASVLFGVSLSNYIRGRGTEARTRSPKSAKLSSVKTSEVWKFVSTEEEAPLLQKED